MKVVVTTQGATGDSPMDGRFGRAENFMLFDTESNQWQRIENGAIQASEGAGVQAAQTVLNAGASALVTGHCGPKAFRALNAGGIEVYTCAGGTAAEAVEKLRAGELAQLSGPDVGGHWI
jgi:predicted Fe-Mo cluster-binding NifX family protein